MLTIIKYIGRHTLPSKNYLLLFKVDSSCCCAAACSRYFVLACSAAERCSLLLEIEQSHPAGARIAPGFQTEGLGDLYRGTPWPAFGDRSLWYGLQYFVASGIRKRESSLYLVLLLLPPALGTLLTYAGIAFRKKKKKTSFTIPLPLVFDAVALFFIFYTFWLLRPLALRPWLKEG
jgi:hypothetical protein